MDNKTQVGKPTWGKPTTYAKTKFKSKYEASVAEYLDTLGISWEYEPVKIPWIPHVVYYSPDFKVTMPNGEWFYLETKGRFDYASRSKMMQLKLQYPQLDIRMMFQRGENHVGNKKTSITYNGWANKYGYTVENNESLREHVSKTKQKRKRKRSKQCSTESPATFLGTNTQQNPK